MTRERPSWKEAIERAKLDEHWLDTSKFARDGSWVVGSQRLDNSPTLSITTSNASPSNAYNAQSILTGGSSGAI